ncbi:MAG TPA: DNA polymerase III subunit delta [Anaerolineae bacterium]|nr:DNA polymerase III subunit delta [Anaerolineae bacterium]
MPAAPSPGPASPRGAPSSPPPVSVFYILHGDDDLALEEELDKLKRDVAAAADLNSHLFTAAQITMSELRHACDTIPFLADCRLVMVRGLLERLEPARKSRDQQPAVQEDPAWKSAFLADLLAYLPHVPPTTRLIFVERKSLDASHRVLKLARELGLREKTHLIECKRPKLSDLPRRITQLVGERQGKITPEAARLLADLIGPDMRLLHAELDKLLAYAEGRPISAQDVQALVSQAREAVIFDLTDCLARRETASALRITHHLLDDGAEPLYVISMLARQVRILIQVGGLRSERLSRDQIVARLGLHPYAVDKALAQAGSFSTEQLQAAHHRIVSADWAIKTGEIEPPLALDLLVVDLSR